MKTSSCLRLLSLLAVFSFAGGAQIVEDLTIDTYVSQPGEGSDATIAEFEIFGTNGLAVGPDGSLYLSNTARNQIDRVTAAGEVTVLTGTGMAGFSGDGGLAVDAELDQPGSVALLPDGSFVFADSNNGRIRKISADGNIESIAGTDGPGSTTDTGLASELALPNVRMIRADSQGNIYTIDETRRQIYRIDGDGMYERLSNDNYVALAVGPNDTIYAATDTQLYRINDVDDRTLIAGTGTADTTGDGGLAVDASFTGIQSLAVDDNGRVFISQPTSHVVRYIQGDRVDTFAGTGTAGFSGNGGAPGEAELDTPTELAVGPSGELYIFDSNNVRLRVVRAGGSSGPQLTTEGIVSAASFSHGPIAPSQIISMFGQGFTDGMFPATMTPLPTELGGVTVTINDADGTDHEMELFYVGHDQINAAVPDDVAEGSATITVRTEDGMETTASVEVGMSAPGIFAANANGEGVAAAAAVSVDSEGAQTPVEVVSPGMNGGPLTGTPIDVSGDDVILLLFGTGLRNAQDVEVTIDGVEADVQAVSAQSEFVGLDQINVAIPRDVAGRGEVDVKVTVDGVETNTVTVTIL